MLNKKQVGSQPTYEELKRHGGEFTIKIGDVLSLPMRN